MFPPLAFPGRAASSLLLALALALPLHAQTVPQDPPTPLPVGMNLRAVMPFTREWVFADAMKIASEWRYEDDVRTPPVRSTKGAPQRPQGAKVPLDALGWPRPAPNRVIGCDLFVSMRGKMPAGEYVVTWKGKGTVELRGHVGIVSQEPKRIVARVDGINGGQPGLKVSNVDPLDPVREIRVWLPGLENYCHSFHPLFVERLRPFSVLRFYPWMRIYSSSGRWAQRSTPAHARQVNAEGVAVEYMVELCNELRAQPWFCIPHTADDDYVRNFATLVRDTLYHSSKVYVEFSNETWNTDFAAGKWARDEARRRGITAMQVVAQRAAQVFDIWQQVFGADKHRVVRVAGVQLHNPGIANSMCRALNGKFDAMAVGAYFGARADRDPVDRDSSATELLAVAQANLDNLILPRIRDHRALADTLGAEQNRRFALFTYEGGQSIFSASRGGGLDLDATLECQTRPEMYDLYRALIEGAEAQGVELFVGYDFVGSRNSHDTFSVLEYLDEPLDRAVKYRALIKGWEVRGQ